MKEIRKITNEERLIILDSNMRSKVPLGLMFYLAILFAMFICMLFIRDFTLLYIFIIGIVVLIVLLIIFPMIYFNYIETGDIEVFESEIVSSKRSDIYYNKVEINGLDNEFIDCKYPTIEHVKVGTKVVVVMLFGRNRERRYILINKEKKELLSSRKTRFDLIDWC